MELLLRLKATSRATRGWLLGLAAGIGLITAPVAEAQTTKVDLELVLAVDVSASMDYDEHLLQRNGYVEAFRHKDVIDAILSGPNGRIAVTYLEWAGTYEPIQTIPWTMIASEKDALAFADRMAAEQLYSERLTSISSALYSAQNLIETNAFTANRRVIDVSGDGANNTGDPVEEARAYVIGRGTTINGLPILLNKPLEWYDIDHLDRYYKQCVIGGDGAFIAPVYDLRHMGATIRKKLVMEIAQIEVAPEAAPIQFAEAQPSPTPGESPETSLLHRVQLKAPTGPVDCMIGEKVWNSRGGFGGFGLPSGGRRGRER
ncbi:DUF1194 domain-containing protein [bacterium]|nr:DUF1194 domain-containing protein [bacterium]